MSRAVALCGLGLLGLGLAMYDWRLACVVVGALVWLDWYVPDDEVKS